MYGGPLAPPKSFYMFDFVTFYIVSATFHIDFARSAFLLSVNLSLQTFVMAARCIIVLF